MNKINVAGRNLLLLFLAATGLSLSACSGHQGQLTGQYGSQGAYDPFEDLNRRSFAVNNALDETIAQPIARGYRAAVPGLARDGVRNFLRNLRSPVNVGNQLLQGDVEGSASDLSRFVINTFIGIGGVFDVAEETGLEYEYEDFGQTLAVWGVDSGPYIMLPILGPSSGRDTAGLLVDSYLDPVRLYLFNTDQDEWWYARVAANGISKREELLDVLDDLKKNSVDYYAAVRSSYTQRRLALISDEDFEAMTLPEIPEYDDE